MLVLAIDTSCDETSVAVVRDLTILSNLMPSQAKLHSEFGGVVPSLARLAHKERIDKVVESAIRRAKITYKDLDAIAVTIGPGLAIALEVGIIKAKDIAKKYDKPLIPVNHMEGHLLSAFAERMTNDQTPITKTLEKVSFPALGVLVSGKHTEIVLVKDFGDYKILGETLDDACGEAYDKCGRMLGLGYPAGPVISKFARENRKNISVSLLKNNKSVSIKCINKKTKRAYILPIPMANSGDLNFSYSGLKTAFRELVDENSKEGLSLPIVKDLSVTFETAALMQIELKLKQAILKYSPKEIWLGGGVVASSRLRFVIRKIAGKEIKLRYPVSNKLTGDNAAMIAIAANTKILKSGSVKKVAVKDLDKIDRLPNLTF